MSAYEIVTSSDGSHTLFYPQLNETYHSLHGALSESRHVYIGEGLEKFPKDKPLHILEIGFGTGLNALLTLQRAEEDNRFMVYHTLEPFPLAKEVFLNLNYPTFFKPALGPFFLAMHESNDGTTLGLTPNFTFTRFQKKLEAFNTVETYDLIYLDAFAPSKQADIWALDNIKRLASFQSSGSILVTYCASGQFKRDLKSAGYDLEVISGPPGKKEMTRGIRQ
jgi:tRNA U34 5-methylaminomethyl-2-thiouridine-forming methyltransferase MnmC